MLRFVFCALLALGECGLMEGQTRPAPPPNLPVGPQPPSTITRPDSIGDNGPYWFWSQMTNQGRAGGVLLGKVRVEGVTLLWEPIFVSISCQGKVVNTARTDSKGNFVFTSVPGVVSAQADVGREMRMYYEGCTVSASLSGFRSDTLTVTERNLRDDPELGSVWLHLANGRASGTALSATSAAAPKKAERLFEKAHAAMLEQNPKRAQNALEEAVRIYPEFADAWYQLGKLLMASSQNAQEAFSKAVAADPQFVPPYEELAQLEAQLQKWKEAAENTSNAVRLEPSGTARLWYFDALANYQLSKLEAAKASAIKSLDMDPRHYIPNTEQLLAVILAQEGDYDGALNHLRNCLTYVKTGPNVSFLNQQIAQVKRAAARSKPSPN